MDAARKQLLGEIEIRSVLMRVRGFSLVEMMTVLAIAAILLAIAVPYFGTMIANARVDSVAESLLAGLVRARAEAIKRNAPMRFQLVTLAADANCTPTGRKYLKSAGNPLWVVSQYVATGTRGVVNGTCVSNPYSPEDNEEPCRLATPASASDAVTGWFDSRLFSPASPPTDTDCLENAAIPTGFRFMCRPKGNPSSCSNEPFIAHQQIADAPAGVVVVGQLGASNISSSDGFVVTFGSLGQLLYNQEEAPLVGSRPAALSRYVLSITSSVANTRSRNLQIESNGMIRMCNPAIADTTNKMSCAS